MDGVQIDAVERERLSLDWAMVTNVGRVRQVNEDAVFAAPGVFAVADGMGGHAAGDVASRLVIEVCERYAAEVPLSLFQVESLVAEANQAVRSHSTGRDETGMGTTLVAVVLCDNGGDEQLVVLNVGDSRCYSWSSDTGLVIETHDHSVVQELVDAGQISPDDAERHPDRHVVTRAIGVAADVAADFVVLPPAPVQRLLLCSDGVSGQLDDELLGSILATAPTPGDAVERLLEAVLVGPAPDNASALVVDVARPLEVIADAGLDDITGPRPASRNLIEETPAVTNGVGRTASPEVGE